MDSTILAMPYTGDSWWLTLTGLWLASLVPQLLLWLDLTTLHHELRRGYTQNPDCYCHSVHNTLLPAMLSRHPEPSSVYTLRKVNWGR